MRNSSQDTWNLKYPAAVLAFLLPLVEQTVRNNVGENIPKLCSVPLQVQFKILRGHSDTVSSCHFCCEDTKILSCSYDGTVKLWVCYEHNNKKIKILKAEVQEHSTRLRLTKSSRRLLKAFCWSLKIATVNVFCSQIHGKTPVSCFERVLWRRKVTCKAYVAHTESALVY